MSRFRIAIVASRFNQDITDKLLESTVQRLYEHGFTSDLITIVRVPGAIEIPITAKRLAKTQKYTVIIALGAVIMGETKHFDYVCQQVSIGCLNVSMDHDIPVIFGVLTTETEEQAYARVTGEHSKNGIYIADAAIEMIATLDKIAHER